MQFKMTTELNNNFKDKFEIDISDFVSNSTEAIDYAKKYLNDRGLQFNSKTIITEHNRANVDVVAVITVDRKTKKINIK
jgi:hypothetical protein